jgi:hypothetical protein
VAESGQPYAFTGDDPLNATDPLGLSGQYISPSLAKYDLKCHGHPHRKGCSGPGFFGTLAGLAKSTFHTVAKHWRGIVHVTIVVTAIAGGVTCALATGGVCGTFLGAGLVTLSGGAVEGVAGHALDGSNQTLEGYLSSAGQGSLQEASFALPEEIFFGAEGAHAQPNVGFVQTLRHLFDNFG